MKKSFSFLLALLLLATLACRSREQESTASGRVQGTITISGAFALYPMTLKWAEEFRKVYPQVKIDVAAGGAGKGIADVLAGVVDIGMVSREIHPTEIEKGAWWVAVTKDAVVPVFNENNPLGQDILARGLKREVLRDIFITGKMVLWQPALGLSGSTPLHVYTRSDSCGAAEIWALFLGGKQEDLQGIGVYSDPGLAEAVRQDNLAIGFNNINYAFDATTLKPVAGIRVLPIDLDGNGVIDPAEDFYQHRDTMVRAIAEGRYPSPPSRDLHFVFKGCPTDTLILAFLRWVLDDGQKYVAESGYIAIASDRLQESLKRLGQTGGN